MAVFHISGNVWESIDDVSILLTYLYDNIDPDNVYINEYLRKYSLENLKKSGSKISWVSKDYLLNPKYKVKAMSKAALTNQGGVSPMGDATEINPYLVPQGSMGVNECFIAVGSEYVCFIEPGNQHSFMVVGIINPSGTSVPYVYVYATTFNGNPNFDSRLLDCSPFSPIFMCFPVGIESFHDDDSHKLFINLKSGRGRISMDLVVGYTEKGDPIYKPFTYSTEIINFDDCRLSNDLELYRLGTEDEEDSDITKLTRLIPDDLAFVNPTVTAHPRNVNTLNDITNLKSIDIFVRDIDSLDLFGFFAHIPHLANCSSYHFTKWFTAKIDYPTTGAKWFLCALNKYIPYMKSPGKGLNIYYQGLAMLNNDKIYFSATDLDKAGVSYILASDSTVKVPFNCEAELPNNTFGVETSKVLNKNCVYNNGIPTGSIIVAVYSPTYTIFYGDENNVFSKLIIKQELVDAASKGGNYTLIDDNGFSLVVSFYNNLWNVLVPITYNCVIFDIYKFTSKYEGGDFGVISSIQ